MRLHQVKIEYDAEQDRLLMRVSTASSEEALLWLTRRCVMRLWPLLVSFAESEPQIAARATDPHIKRVLFEFQHEKALSQASFSKAYEDTSRARPLGDNPLLVARLQRRKADDGRMILGMLPAQGQGIFLTLDAPLLHGLIKLLQGAVEKAEWGFTLKLPTAEPPGSKEGAPTLN
jgi:hypothetical protein